MRSISAVLWIILTTSSNKQDIDSSSQSPRHSDPNISLNDAPELNQSFTDMPRIVRINSVSQPASAQKRSSKHRNSRSRSIPKIDDSQKILLFRQIQKALDQFYRNRDGIFVNISAHTLRDLNT